MAMYRIRWRTLALAAVALLCAAAPLPIFTDIAADSGIVEPNTFGGVERKDYILETTGNGAAIFDYNNDGRNDIFVTNGTRFDLKSADAPSSQLYRNEGNGKFQNLAEKAGLTQAGWAQAACAADYDNDGWTDLFVTYFGVNQLYRNRTAKFENVTAKALPSGRERWGAGCAFVDYDRDGFVDLFVSNYVDLNLSDTPKPGSRPECIWKSVPVMCGPRGLPMARNALYRNRGDGTFVDVSESAGILAPGGRYGLGVAAADFNNDGWPDIYVACDQTPSLLYQNQRNGRFRELGIEAGVAYNLDGRLQAGMGVAVADFDGNGFLDIAKTNFSGDLPSLYMNEDGEFFQDVSQRAGLGVHQLLGWGVAWVDVDEDGWNDLVMVNGHVYPEVERTQTGDRYRQRSLLFRNLGNGRFADWTAQAGPGFEQTRPARGLAAGDLDGDGFPELFIVNMNQGPSVLKRQSRRANWVRLELRGIKSNRSAIGARVTIEAEGRRRMGEVSSGSSYYSQNEFALHFGLGTAKAIDRIEVRWPNGARQEWIQPPMNRTIRLVEGESKPLTSGAIP